MLAAVTSTIFMVGGQLPFGVAAPDAEVELPVVTSLAKLLTLLSLLGMLLLTRQLRWCRCVVEAAAAAELLPFVRLRFSGAAVMGPLGGPGGGLSADAVSTGIMYDNMVAVG